MGTRLYLTFINDTAEEMFIGVSVGTFERVRKLQELGTNHPEFKEWISEGKPSFASYYEWIHEYRPEENFAEGYNLTMLDSPVYNLIESLGLGKVCGTVTDKELMVKFLECQSCKCEKAAEAIPLVEKGFVTAVSWS